jgi:hypothetical protein
VPALIRRWHGRLLELAVPAAGLELVEFAQENGWKTERLVDLRLESEDPIPAFTTGHGVLGAALALDVVVAEFSQGDV